MLLERKFLHVTVAVISILVLLLVSQVPSDQPFLQSDLSELARNLTIVVTGANSGLGLGTVEHLARAGTAKTVVLACRNRVKCQAAKDKASSLLPPHSKTQLLIIDLDLANRSSIERFADELLQLLVPQGISVDDVNNTGETPVIDVLINNAGIFATSADVQFVHNVEEHIYVNYLGHVLLTHLLWPTLERSKARVISVSSIAALFPFNPSTAWDASNRPWSEAILTTGGFVRYARSKRANLYFAQELHRRMYARGIGEDGGGVVSSVASHPGFTRSEIWSTGAKCFPSFLVQFMHSLPLISMSSSEGALTQLWAALDRTRVSSGSYVGPRWWIAGTPVNLGAIDSPDFPFHFAPLYSEDVLWNRTMNELGIRTFGRPGV